MGGPGHLGARWWAVSLALGLFAASAVTTTAHTTIEAQTRRGFTAAERASLEAGRLVMRRREERRGALVHFGGTSFQVVDRPIVDVWLALQDPSSYRNLLPQVASVRTVRRVGREATVRLEHSYGLVHATYHLRFRFDPARHDVSFDLDPSLPHDIHSATGFATLSPWPGRDDRTLISWGILAAIDEGIVSAMIRPQIHDWMLRVPATMRAHLHGAGRTQYVADRGGQRPTIR